MKKLFLTVLIVITANAAPLSLANASVITLDFDSPGTGSTILVSPLVTPAGTITASASGTSTLGLVSFDGFTGNTLFHNQASVSDSDFAQLAFDFDVNSLTFLYGGSGAGVFSAQALDAGLALVDSFFDSDTFADRPGGPVTLSGSGIRYFRFGDFPGGFEASAVDDVQIVTPMPEPTTLAILGLGLAGLGVMRRRLTGGPL